MNDSVHVYLGHFQNRNAACEYTEPQWEPEPDDSVSDKEYWAWEDRNPSWQMFSELGLQYLDSDSIETIDGDNRYEYLRTILTEKNAIDRIKSMADDDQNILVLIFSEALGGFPSQMRSTPKLKYCGEFACEL